MTDHQLPKASDYDAVALFVLKHGCVTYPVAEVELDYPLKEWRELVKYSFEEEAPWSPEIHTHGRSVRFITVANPRHGVDPLAWLADQVLGQPAS